MGFRNLQEKLKKVHFQKARKFAYVIYGWPLRMLSELDKRYTGADYTLDKNSKDTIKPGQIKPLKGQAHHLFSRIFRNRRY